MKLTIVFAAAVLGLAATVAHAESEGNGDPFPFRMPGIVSATVATPSAPSVASVPPASGTGHDVAEAPTSRSGRHS